jgi:RimJ/RimL family protein N-acetyltransferase
MSLSSEKFSMETTGLLLKATLVSWDTEIFHFPVGTIESFQIIDPYMITRDYMEFELWRDINQCKLISCRLSHDQLYESIFLEGRGFRFIETVLHPKLDDLLRLNVSDQGLEIIPANENDLPALTRIAESAFRNERFHVDPRLDPRFGDLRYVRWVENTLKHPQQRLIKILDNETIVAFFIIEFLNDGHVYWHLTAVSPEHQGKGYGRRTWLAMLRYHQKNGCLKVSTTISARNIPVLNLYSSLNFRFLPPEMTFHWKRE